MRKLKFVLVIAILLMLIAPVLGQPPLENTTPPPVEQVEVVSLLDLIPLWGYLAIGTLISIAGAGGVLAVWRQHRYLQQFIENTYAGAPEWSKPYLKQFAGQAEAIIDRGGNQLVVRIPGSADDDFLEQILDEIRAARANLR